MKTLKLIKLWDNRLQSIIDNSKIHEVNNLRTLLMALELKLNNGVIITSDSLLPIKRRMDAIS
jgi:CTP:phosphocholine cytidylyltransferase-like protein